MDAKILVAEAKARFNHNSAKAQLQDKYEGKLIVADQGGLWKASPELISFLNAIEDNFVILIDNFDNPLEINRKELLDNLKNTYTKIMRQWYDEWKELETKR